MILTCPNCQTRYQADETSFPQSGRKVRCAKCGHMWHQPAPEAESTAAQPAPPAEPVSGKAGSLPATGRAATPRPKSRRRPLAERLGIVAGWAGLVAMVLLIGWVGFRFRQEIATLWPKSSSLYATFGVAVNPHGINIDDVSYRREVSNGQPVLAVSARLVNQSTRELPVPPVRISLTDDTQHELYHWNYPPPQRTLKPGESLSFLTRLTGAPPSTRNLQLHFASQE